MGSLAMKATERDPDFLKNFEKAVKGKRQQGEATVQVKGCASGGEGRAAARHAAVCVWPLSSIPTLRCE